VRQVRHPLVDADIDGIVDHILEVTGDVDAAERRLDEIDALLAAIAERPLSGVRLDGALDGWLVRHGGRDLAITIVFRPEVDRDTLRIALVAFGGRNWLGLAEDRRSFEAPRRSG
jgi:plasmid stabilization system protein ParE